MKEEVLQEFFDYFVRARDIDVLKYIPAHKQEYFSNLMMERFSELQTDDALREDENGSTNRNE